MDDFTIFVAPPPTRCTPRDVPAVFHVHNRDAEYGTHVTAHYDHESFPLRTLPAEDCAYCAAQMFLPELHAAWTHGTDAERALLWSLQDGYGVPGFVPGQGPDWSGIRDSLPATVYAMHRALQQARK